MASTDDEFITALKSFLSTNIGRQSIRHPDGRQITFDRAQAMKELAYWESRKSAAANATTGLFGRSRFGLKGDA